MTRSPERGENEITRLAKRLAAQSGRDVCDILEEMLAEAQARADSGRVMKVRRAQKYLGCRNRRRRKKK